MKLQPLGPPAAAPTRRPLTRSVWHEPDPRPAPPRFGAITSAPHVPPVCCCPPPPPRPHDRGTGRRVGPKPLVEWTRTGWAVDVPAFKGDPLRDLDLRPLTDGQAATLGGLMDADALADLHGWVPAAGLCEGMSWNRWLPAGLDPNAPPR